MEDGGGGGESRVIKNMKMKKIWDAVFGLSAAAAGIFTAP